MTEIIRYINDFNNIIEIIERAKTRAIKAVNAEMIEMYWQIGKFVSEKAASDGWGKGNEKLSPLVREITWSNNLIIMSNCKTDEAKEFYIRLCIDNNYGKRELERQIDSML